MAGFIQIIEFTTTRVDEIRALAETYRTERLAAGDTPVLRSIVTADRERPNTYLNLVEFPSYEAAMKNSENPATADFAGKMMALCDGPPRFYNLDVVENLEFAGS
jgi:hypothetical protein